MTYDAILSWVLGGVITVFAWFGRMIITNNKRISLLEQASEIRNEQRKQQYEEEREFRHNVLEFMRNLQNK